MSKGTSLFRLLAALLACLPLAGVSWAAHISTHAPKSKSQQSKISESQRTRRRIHHLARSRSAHLRHASVRVRRRRSYERFHMSSFAEDIAAGDITTGEDRVVRQAAVDALGNMNGTVVAIEPTSGRVLAMVNQKLALSSGAQPCSTIKLSVALAALSEGLVSKETQVALGGRSRMNLTTAIAHSNNAYFESVGRKLGFEKVAYYAHQYGLGELAGYDIPGEQLGSYPEEAIPAKLGGVGKMCSYGEGVSMTPLQLGAMVSAIANGGTLYYLQRRRSSGQDGNLLACRNALRLVRLLCQHQRWARGGRRLPAGRTSHLRAQGGRNCWTHLSQHVRPQLLHRRPRIAFRHGCREDGQHNPIT